MEWIVEAETLEDLVDGHGVSGQRIVRCKDCRWWAKDEIMHDTTQRRCTEHECYFEPDDFCSWGEREEDEAD